MTLSTQQPLDEHAPSMQLPHTTAYDPTRAERALWKAVITQALMDAASNSHKRELQQRKQEARVWLRGNSADFLTVCENAGLDPAYVREQAASALARNCQWRQSSTLTRSRYASTPAPATPPLPPSLYPPRYPTHRIPAPLSTQEHGDV